jgi:hypothetical protein
MVEEMIDGIDLQVAESNLAWKVEFYVLTVIEELVKSTNQIAFYLVINESDSFWIRLKLPSSHKINFERNYKILEIYNFWDFLKNFVQ